MNVLLQEFKDRIRVAAETHQTLSLQGHGSKAFYGETPLGDTLDVSGYSGVLSYEPSELVVTARDSAKSSLGTETINFIVQ